MMFCYHFCYFICVVLLSHPQRLCPAPRWSSHHEAAASSKTWQTRHWWSRWSSARRPRRLGTLTANKQTYTTFFLLSAGNNNWSFQFDMTADVSLTWHIQRQCWLSPSRRCLERCHHRDSCKINKSIKLLRCRSTAVVCVYRTLKVI